MDKEKNNIAIPSNQDLTKSVHSVNEGFEVKCLKCGSHNINIDFIKDIFWCEDCDNIQGCLDLGKTHFSGED